jgi:hypothetical protein
MSFVTAQSPALMAAANQLQHLGTAMAAQNTAAAMPTTEVTPAAADPVSAMQAMQFSAYGTWYQQVSQQAEAIHQMLANTLGSNPRNSPVQLAPGPPVGNNVARRLGRPLNSGAAWCAKPCIGEVGPAINSKI